MQETETCSASIVRNLSKKACKAKVYETVWRPEVCVMAAGQLIEPLRRALQTLRASGWDNYYVALMSLAESYLAACEKNPNVKIEVSQ